MEKPQEIPNRHTQQLSAAAAPSGKPPYVEPRLSYVEPRLTKQGDVSNVTAAFFGSFSP